MRVSKVYSAQYTMLLRSAEPRFSSPTQRVEIKDMALSGVADYTSSWAGASPTKQAHCMAGGIVPNELKIFSGSSHPKLAQDIADHLSVPLGKAQTIKFTNENLKVKILENVRDADVFVVQTSCPPVNEGLMELFIMIHALKYASARRITAVLPYYPYTRSDKKDEPRISIAAALVADLLQTAGVDRVLTLDLHSPQEQGFFRIPSDHLTAVPLLCDTLLADGELENAVLVAADVGEAKDAGRAAKRLRLPLAIIDKRRYADDEKAAAVHIIGDVKGKRALLVDDEIATGGTILGAAEILLRNGARDVSVVAVHPVLCGTSVARLGGDLITRLTVTDSIPIPDAKIEGTLLQKKLSVISVSGLIADGIRRICDGRSVSELFR
jgi:ribose-phosphate pyrophosphokinase